MSGGGSPSWIGTSLANIVTSLGLPADIRGYLALMLVARS